MIPSIDLVYHYMLTANLEKMVYSDELRNCSVALLYCLLEIRVITDDYGIFVTTGHHHKLL